MDALRAGAAERPHVRRRFVEGAARLGLSAAGLALLAGCEGRGQPAATAGPEPAPETTRLKLHHALGLCLAPQYVAEELLRDEGFTEITYARHEDTGGIYPALVSGAADIVADFAPPLIRHVDAGEPITVLGGIHVGCFELFGTDQVRAIRDLKGKTVAVRALDSPPHVFLAIMAAYVGLDPAKDITWDLHPPAEAMQLLAEGRVDAYVAFPPEAQELRARGIGHVVVKSTLDRPWSQYFCCMLAGNKDFVQKHPVATKRATRAMLKATDLCATEPELAAQTVVDRGVTTRYDYALQTIRDVRYGKWREYDPEDTVRFYSLRLQEIRMIKASPNAIIQNGTNWRFFDELKRELKG
jgi:NitT/TauT family transport system substrate-binding protein